MLARRTQPMVEGPIDVLDREFNRMLNRFWGSAEVPATLAPYAVDVHEDADRFYVDAEMPGFRKEDIEITLEEGVLTIRGSRKDEGEEKKEGERLPLHMERRWSRFERSFTLPTAVNENSVKATLEEGILKITLDKREEVKPRKIQITAGMATSPNGPKTLESSKTLEPKSSSPQHMQQPPQHK
ncbi:MAG: Hsp20/alpha crystallin family protein [Phycisphaerales bacterium]|nr:Hsp20/alpha crystallin family protein [Phycisphaerales bacterium]